MKNLALLTAFAWCVVSHAQVNAVWRQSVVDTRDSHTVDAVATPDGGVAVAGTVDTVDGSNWIVVKYSSAGSLQWTREIPNPNGGLVSMSGFGGDSAGNLYIGGHWYGGSANDFDLAWAKLNSNGAITSTQTYDFGLTTDLGIAFVVRPDGTSVIAGNSWTNGLSVGRVRRLSATGTVLGSLNVDEGNANSDQLTALHIQASGRVYALGFSRRPANRAVPLLGILEPNQTSSIQFAVHPGIPNNLPRTLTVDSFGDVLIGGDLGLLPQFRAYFSRLPAPSYQAPELPLLSTPASSTLQSLLVAPDDAVYGAGVREQTNGTNAAFITRLGLGPTPLWTFDYGDSLRDESIASLIRDTNGSLYLAGSIDKPGGGSNFWLMKTTSAGVMAYDYRWTTTSSRGQGTATRVIPLGNKQIYVAGTVPNASGGPRISVAKLSENSEIRFVFSTPGFSPDWSLLPLTVEVTNQADGSVLFLQTLVADANGNFTLQGVPDATYRIRVTSPLMTKRQVLNFLVVGGSPIANISLPYGDSDSDGVVSILDYIMLSNAFDTQVGDAAFDPLTDFDRDGVISILDYVVLSSNYESQDDY